MESGTKKESSDSDVGGSLHYNHSSHIDKRQEYEKARQVHSEVMLQFSKFTADVVDQYQLPSSVKDAEHLMQESLKIKESLNVRVSEGITFFDGLLESLKQQDATNMAESSNESAISSLEILLQELRAKLEQLESIWLVCKHHMDHMIRICHFNENAKELKKLMKGYIKSVKNAALGDTLENALEQGEKYIGFMSKWKKTLDKKMGQIQDDVQVLINSDFVSDEESKMHSATQQAIDSVKEQVEELKKNYKELTDLCQQKRDLFIVCVKFHMTTRQIQLWNDNVLEFLATLYLEDMSQEEVLESLSKTEKLQNHIQESQLMTMAELANSLPTEKKFKRVAETTEEKYKKICGFLEVCISHIQKRLKALEAPAAAVTSSNLAEKWKNGSRSTQDSSSNSNPSDSTDGEEDPNILKSRHFIYKELVATEKAYIEDLKTILDSYYDAMDPEESTSLPLRLRDKRSVVFGNLPEIYKFHETIFCKALEQYEKHPERVGECFIQFMKEFQMYSVYCKNCTQSATEALINECTECQAFFKRIQMSLAHQLSLDSYLLKPVQRITKYQLLLKDMMKRSVNAKVAHGKLKKALDRMLKVLKDLNDSLHVVGLKGFPGSLAEQGRLLLHDPFQLSSDGAWSPFSSLRTHQRHVFLFEKMVIFSKKTEVSVGQKKEKKSDSYVYKEHLPMAEIGLRTAIEGQPLHFELYVQGQQKVYRLQAQTKEVYDMWTSEINRVLESQLTMVKDILIRMGSIDETAYEGSVKLSIHSKNSQFFADSPKTKAFKQQQLQKPEKDKKLKRSSHVEKPEPQHSVRHNTGSLPFSVCYSLKGGKIDATSEKDARRIETDYGDESDKDDRRIETDYGDDTDGSEPVVSDEGQEISDEDETDTSYEMLSPSASHNYSAICDYSAGDSDENGISLTEGQKVEVIGVNQFGWWWVRATHASSGEMEEGWVPASYLKCQPTYL